MRYVMRSMIVALALLFYAAAAPSEETRTKQELVIELIEASGGAESAMQVAQSMLASIQQNYDATVKNLLDAQPHLSQAQRSAIESHLSDFSSVQSRFASEFAAAIDFDEIIREVYVPLYAEHFSESELRELLAFQRSAVGQKAARLLPTIAQQGMERMLPRIQPKIFEVVRRVLAEEQELALAELRSH